MSLRVRLSSYWCAFQEYLFPTIDRPRSPGGIATSCSSPSSSSWCGWNNICPVWPSHDPDAGRPQQDRVALARAVHRQGGVPDRHYHGLLLERLANDFGRCAACAAGRVCGSVPSEATFRVPLPGSLRAPLPMPSARGADREHHAGAVGRSCVTRKCDGDRGARGPTAKPKQPAKPKRKRGRPRKGEERPKEPSRLQRQQQMTLVEMLDDLPHACDVGTKRNSAKGYKESWIGYKLHIDAGDGGIRSVRILTDRPR